MTTTTLTKETTSVKLDKVAKEEAKIIFRQLGLTMGEAFNLFLHQVQLNKGLPKKVLDEGRQGKNIEDFSISELK